MANVLISAPSHFCKQLFSILRNVHKVVKTRLSTVNNTLVHIHIWPTELTPLYKKSHNNSYENVSFWRNRQKAKSQLYWSGLHVRSSASAVHDEAPHHHLSSLIKWSFCSSRSCSACGVICLKLTCTNVLRTAGCYNCFMHLCHTLYSRCMLICFICTL